jgi:hypothetical protein
MLALSYGFFVMSMFAAGVMVLAVWPSALVLAWILAVSVVLLLQQRPAPTAAPPSP